MKKKTEEETGRDMLDGTKGIVEALFDVGAMTDDEAKGFVERRREAGAKPLAFEEALLSENASRSIGAQEIKAIRKKEGASQASLAKHLGVATATVGQWERGQRRPDGAATKLLSLVQAKGLDYIR